MSYAKLESACRAGDLSAFEAVLARLNTQQQRELIQQSDQGKDTPLHYACQYGHLAVARVLIDKGADVEAKNRNQWTPLHEACLRGHLSLAEMLIVNGADIMAENDVRAVMARCYT
eukprot:TRINITY_DN12203_c0_g1_i1.p1 TRINITY_DN12203_c0_g1~~TRINITY_DN12203_c0_g1_i1.p1  ORF type:complete len:116 (+),score=7.35 TRINITY_DN12203_c0_g1_i1:113-460(+)